MEFKPDPAFAKMPGLQQSQSFDFNDPSLWSSRVGLFEDYAYATTSSRGGRGQRYRNAPSYQRGSETPKRSACARFLDPRAKKSAASLPEFPECTGTQMSSTLREEWRFWSSMWMSMAQEEDTLYTGSSSTTNNSEGPEACRAEASKDTSESRGTKRSSHLKTDKKVQSSGEDSKAEEHQCGFCKKMLRSKRAMKRHQLTHTGEKRYSCSECGNKFVRKENMKRPQANAHRSSHLKKAKKCSRVVRIPRLKKPVRLLQKDVAQQGEP
nr:zinc finger protein 260-like [Rhipicephalus microplus]